MFNVNERSWTWKINLAALTMAVLLAGCGGKQAEPAVTPDNPPAVETPVQEEAPAAEDEVVLTAPLTGMPVEEASSRRPLAVMINNAPAARPQSGLSQADIVYEVLAEGGITRLIGIFQSQTGIETIGPIRSIRPYLIDIGESYDGVLVHAGGSPQAYSIIQNENKADLDEIGSAGAYFWRSSDRKAPHNLYSNDEKLREGLEKHKYASESLDVPSYTFIEANNGDESKGEEAAAAGETALKADITFQLKGYVVSYTYDEELKAYTRSINGEPHIDLNNNEALKASNVVILGADHKVLDDVGRLSVNLDTGGEAMLLQGGQVIRGEWSRASNDVIRFMKDGKETPFYPGTTHFLIVPNSPAFDTHISISTN